jgi:hypothetical protein
MALARPGLPPKASAAHATTSRLGHKPHQGCSCDVCRPRSRSVDTVATRLTSRSTTGHSVVV